MLRVSDGPSGERFAAPALLRSSRTMDGRRRHAARAPAPSLCPQLRCRAQMALNAALHRASSGRALPCASLRRRDDGKRIGFVHVGMASKRRASRQLLGSAPRQRTQEQSRSCSIMTLATAVTMSKLCAGARSCSVGFLRSGRDSLSPGLLLGGTRSYRSFGYPLHLSLPRFSESWQP